MNLRTKKILACCGRAQPCKEGGGHDPSRFHLGPSRNSKTSMDHVNDYYLVLQFTPLLSCDPTVSLSGCY
jgi:hypothetical protein